MSEWLLKLVDGTVVVGEVEDIESLQIEMKDPRTVIKGDTALCEKRSMPLSYVMKTDVIYIERTAIVYWAKPKSNLR